QPRNNQVQRIRDVIAEDQPLRRIFVAAKKLRQTLAQIREQGTGFNRQVVTASPGVDPVRAVELIHELVNTLWLGPDGCSIIKIDQAFFHVPLPSLYEFSTIRLSKRCRVAKARVPFQELWPFLSAMSIILIDNILIIRNLVAARPVVQETRRVPVVSVTYGVSGRTAHARLCNLLPLSGTKHPTRAAAFRQ